MQTVRTLIAGRRSAAGHLTRAAVVVGAALLVCGCNTDKEIAGVPSAPVDYRQRHPITITEGERTFELFIGSSRGTLNPMQRAELLAFAQSWRHEATGGVIVELPTGSGNERAAAEALHEITSTLTATGVPAHGIAVQNYRAAERNLAAVRITYPKVVAQAGPCGLWPEDIGPSMNRDYFENQPYWNLGCAHQRDLAAMVDNPADLVQPRGETPAYAMRRTTVMEKYRIGASPATTYPTAGTGKISNISQ
jgi:pilus assembly protein CpaD